MKINGILIIAILLLVGSMGFFTLQDNSYLVGLAVLDQENSSIETDVENYSFTRDDAIQAIEESEEIILEMKAANFSGVLISDILLEAEKTFQLVEYAEILRGNINATEGEENEARRALALVNWKSINYSDVEQYTEDIKEVRELAFFVQDLLLVQESFLGAERNEEGEIVAFNKVEEVDLDRFKTLINDIQKAIDESRYDDARVLAEELKEETELRRTEVFTSLVLARSFGNLLIKYWYVAVIIVILIILIIYYFINKLRKTFLKRKIEYMKEESKAILNLEKRAQEERFKKYKLSALVYNIRMKRYGDKLQQIKRELPVLEKRLEILNSKRRYKTLKKKTRNKNKKNGIESSRTRVKEKLSDS